MLQRLYGGLGLVSKEAARLASLELVLKEKDALLQVLSASLKDKDSQMTFCLKEKDARLQILNVSLKDKAAAFAKDLETLQYALDTAESRFEARSVLEAILPNLWLRVQGKRPPSGTANQLAGLLKEGACPGLLAYLQQAAEDNGVREADLLRQTGELYDVLCERLHAEAAGGTTSVPAELFKHSGRTTLLAFAALASFSGRDLSLYRLGGAATPLKLRALRGDCSATQAEVRASALLERKIGVKEIPLQ